MVINKTKISTIAILGLTLIYWPFSVCLAQEKFIDKEEIIKLVNESRKKEGLTPVLENPILEKIASDKAQDMINNKYFSHNSPTGMTPWHWFEKDNYNYEYAGENLAINYDDALEQHQAWMSSQKHRQNILNVNFMEIGVATVPFRTEGKNSLLTVQEFGTPKGVAIPKQSPIKKEIKYSFSYPLEPEFQNGQNRSLMNHQQSLGATKTNPGANGTIYKNMYLIIMIISLVIAFTGPAMIILSRIRKSQWKKMDDIAREKVVVSWGEYLGFFKGISEGNISGSLIRVHNQSAIDKFQ